MRRVAAVVLAVGLAAACSGGGLTKAQFIRQGDAICARLARAGSALDVPGGPAATEAALDRVVGLARRARADLAALDPPTDGDRVQRQLLAFLDATVTSGGRARRAIAAGDRAAAQQALLGVTGPALAAQQAAEDYGFRECGGPTLPG